MASNVENVSIWWRNHVNVSFIYITSLQLYAPVTTGVARWKPCVQDADSYLGRATSRMYVDAFFEDTTKQDVSASMIFKSFTG